MGRTKPLFLFGAILMFVVLCCFEANSAESGTKPKSYEYTGIIKAQSQEDHLLTVQTQGGPIQFHYQRHGRRECAGFKELSIGDHIKVLSPDNKPLSEATCVTKVKPTAVPK